MHITEKTIPSNLVAPCMRKHGKDANVRICEQRKEVLSFYGVLSINRE